MLSSPISGEIIPIDTLGSPEKDAESKRCAMGGEADVRVLRKMWADHL